MKVSFISTMALAAIGLSMGFASPGHAALISCPASFTADGTAKVMHSAGTQSAASACQYMSPANNSTVANVATVNANAFFGHTDWIATVVSQANANSLTGTWTIAGANFAAFDYMITFKSGAGTNLTSFLFNEEASNGTWSTPFTDPPFDLPGNSVSHEVSHYSIFARSNPTQVAEPATALLLGAGLLGLGVIARRRKSA